MKLKTKDLQLLLPKPQLLKKYSETRSYAKIANEFNLTESQMKRLLLSYQIIADKKQSKVYVLSKRISKEQLQVDLQENSVCNIAKKYDVSTSALYNLLIYYNIYISPQESARKSAITKSKFTEERMQEYRNKLSESGKRHWNTLVGEERLVRCKNAIKTKQRNHSFHISKPEGEFYQFLIQNYGESNTFHQYKDINRYPFQCDFYIKSLDMFIELNLFWMHDTHIFNIENEEDLMSLNQLKIRGIESPIFNHKIVTWTEKDINKVTTALNNNLNYMVIYDKLIYYHNSLIKLPEKYRNHKLIAI